MEILVSGAGYGGGICLWVVLVRNSGPCFWVIGLGVAVMLGLHRMRMICGVGGGARRWLVIGAAIMVAGWVAGCVGDARVELAAAQSLGQLAAAMDQSVREYHDEIAVSDDEREAAIVSAYLTRVRADAANPGALASHERDLVAALEKLRADRDVEASRFAATVDHIALLRETATQLRHSAIKTAAMNKETRAYFESVADAISDRSRGEVAAGE